jgi:beta-lactam-binding protein with PASTA domain
VPNVIGQSRHSAEQAIEDAGLRPSTQHVPSNEAKDTVVSQSPSGGSTPSRARACC